MYKGYLGCKTQTLLQVIFRVNLVLVVFALSNPIHNHSFKNHHEIKRRLLLGKKIITILDSILKSRNITLPTKVCLVKAMVFPVVMYGCERWTLKKLSAEELMLLNCGVEEDSWESLGLQGDPISLS